MKKMKTAIALACLLALALSLAACGGSTEAYVFEAEHALITDGTGTWAPVTQVGIDMNTDKPARVDGISNISDGTTLTWKITADKAGSATITLRVGSHLREWGIDDAQINAIADISQALSLSVNGAPVAITGSVPGGPQTVPEDADEGALAYFIADIPVEIQLKAGENVISFTALGTSNDYNLFMDSLAVKTGSTLTFTETDNSDRVWGM